jgi:hypothetical protein
MLLSGHCGHIYEQIHKNTPFLDEVYAQMPDVSEEEIQKEIEEALAAVRGR